MMPTTRPMNPSTTMAVASPAGTRRPRSHDAGGSRTVETMRARATGKITTQSCPTIQPSTNTAAAMTMSRMPQRWSPPKASSMTAARSRDVRLVMAASLVGQMPVDRGGALLLEQGVDPAERAGPEEPAGRRQRAGVGALDRRRAAQHRLEALRVPSPEHRDERLRPLDEGTDRLLRDGLPSVAAMTGRRAGPHGEDAVEQQDALLRPGRQVAVRAGRDAEVGLSSV